jgi:hypothetical protein
MTRITLGPTAIDLVLALAGALVLSLPGVSAGQEKHKISWASRPENTKVTVNHALEIPDAPRHVVRMLEIRRTFPENPPIVSGLKLVEDVAWGVYDTIAGNGRGSGYFSWRLENGDQVLGDWQDTVQTVFNPDGSRKATFVGIARWTGGTGKIRGIKGIARYSGFSEFSAAGALTRNEVSADAEYSIEK